LMRNGKCPICGAQEVYSGVQVTKASKSSNLSSIPTGGNMLFGFSYAALDNYVCGKCGYVESYVADPSKLEEIASRWPQVQYQETNDQQQ
jgi:predicted nucleic-acid-binding Zn-ribbon protein